jgi:hypothetical protein
LIFLVKTTGAILSTTTTMAVSVEIFPYTSVTFKVTKFGPILLQLKEDFEISFDAIPLESNEPLSISSAVIATDPAESS